jgi:hypothetical protein
MKKERFSNFLKDGIEMLNQGEDINKVRTFLENVVEKVKKTELSDELKEDLAYYKKLNEKFKDNEDIDLKKVEKNIKEYQEERLGQLLDKTVVFGEKFRIDTTELNDDVFDETSEEYDMDFKYTTLNEFLGDDDSLLYKRYDLPSEVHSKKEEEDRDYQLYKEIIMEAKAYGNVIKERFQNITDENGYIEKEDLKELCEDFNFNAEDKFIELNDDIEKSPKEKLEYEKKDLENKTETFDFMNKHTKFKEDEEKFKKSVKEYQKDFLDYVIKTELNETSPNEYRFKNNDFLQKNKDWKELVERFREVEKVNPIKDNIDKNSLYERYDIKGEDRLYQSILENKGIGKEIDFYEERVRLDLKDRTVGKGKDFLEVKELVHLYNSYEMPEKLSFALGLIDVRKNMKERELNEEKSDNPEINKNSEINKFEYSDELKEKLNHYEKLNEKVKDKIDLKEFEKEIDDYKKNVIIDYMGFVRVGEDKFKNSDDISELEEEFIVDFKNTTFKSFEEKSPYLLYERYGLEEKLPDFKVTVDGFDFFNSKNDNKKLEEKLKEEKNINIKDIVEFSNHIKETFKNNDVEILFEKENGEYAKYNYGDYVESVYDELLDNISEEAKVYRQAIKEEIDNITDKDGTVKEKDLKKVFDKYEISADYLFKNKEIKNVELEEKAPEKKNTNNNEVKKKLTKYEEDLIKDIVDIFNGVDIFKDKETKNIEAEEKTPKKEYTNNNELKEEIRSYQQDIIEAVVENEFEKISKNEYKLKDNTLLNKENWEKELKTDKYKDYNAFYIFDNTMTRTEMVERYDLDKKLSPFEIYTNDGDLLYNSASENNDFDKIREYAKENLANYDFEEFINEDLTKFENWQKVTTYDIGIGITELNGEKKQIYDVYDYTDPVYKELCQEIDKEKVDFEEEIRLSFKEHIDNDIIKSDDILKVFEKFDSGNDKRLENFEKKINDMEVSVDKQKRVDEKSKDREKDF